MIPRKNTGICFFRVQYLQSTVIPASFQHDLSIISCLSGSHAPVFFKFLRFSSFYTGLIRQSSLGRQVRAGRQLYTAILHIICILPVQFPCSVCDQAGQYCIIGSLCIGQLIAQLDDREFVAQLDSAKASVASAEASLAVAKADWEQEKANYASSRAATENAQANYEDKAREQKRMAGLVASNAGTQQSLDQANTALAQATAQLSQARANEAAAQAKITSAEADIQRSEASIAQAKASLETAELNYAETRIYAPMRGVVSAKLVDPGVMISSSTPIVTIVSMATVKVVVAVPVNHLARVIPGKTHATLTTPALPGREIDCVVEKVYPTVDTVTRTAQVEFRVKNERDEATRTFLLRPGMYASVAVLLEERNNVVAIDLSLPVRNLDRNLVYVCQGDAVKAVPVKLGTTFQGMVEVLEGLQAGDEIVVQGQHRLTDGSKIRRVQPETPAR